MPSSLARNALTVLATILLVSAAAEAGVTIDTPFGNGMVIQRGVPVTVSGGTDAEGPLVVTFGGKRKKIEVKDGRWSIVLDAMKPGSPRRLTVADSGGASVEIRDILVGDVWLCSGQSNMQWPVNRSSDAKKEIEEANHPRIRLLMVPHQTAVEPTTLKRASWYPCTPKSVAGFSAVGYFFGRELSRSVRVPIGLVNSSWGGTPAEAWTRSEALTDDALRDGHKQMVASKKAGPRLPSCLWNGMVHPLTGFPIRGVIWYQGESNASRAEQYRTLFPAMIRDWREQWGVEDLPFYFVQLANFGKDAPNARGCPWAELREAQLHTLRTVPNTGMAVTLDIGNPKDIHPKNKQEVGRRLARWALAGVYGKKVAVSGPLPESHRIDGKQIVVTFEHTDGGLKLRPGAEGLTALTIAGEDRVFHPAKAKVDGSTLVVSSPAVKKPVAVRYGWANSPVATLFNGKGLPSSPFRTDDWPRLTAGKK